MVYSKIACTYLLFILILTGAVQGATFQSDGSIVSNNTFVTLRSDKQIVISNSFGDQYALQLWFVDKANHSLSPDSGLGQTKKEIDPAHSSTIVTGEFTTPEHPTPIQLRYGFSLKPSGIVHVSVDFVTDVPLSDVLSECNLRLAVNRSQLNGHLMQADEDSHQITLATTPNDDQSFYHTQFNATQYKSVTFFGDAPSRKVVFSPTQTQPLRFYNDNPNEVSVIFRPVGSSISFDVDVNPQKTTASPDSYAGIDFWATDKLRVPNFGLCRNLIQNPGFEDGLRYWQYFMGGGVHELHGNEHYLIDTQGPVSGKHALKLIGDKGEECALISTFGIPLESGATYTLSFYAKSDRPGVALSNWNVTGQGNGGAPGSQWYSLTTQWKRYSTTFIAPNNLIACSFNLPKSPEARVAWLDDVQLERGTLSDYVEKPAGCHLVTNRRNNLFQMGEKVHGRIEIHAPAHAQGTVTITAVDFSGKTIRKETRKFNADSAGVADVALPWAEGLSNGLYVVETDLHLAEGFADREFQRLAIMPSLTKPYAHQNLFSYVGADSQDNWTRQFGFWRSLGTGSFIHFDPPSHGFLQTWAGMGGFQFADIFEGGNNSGDIKVKDDAAAPPYTSEQLKTIEENAYRKAKSYPEIKYWKTINEPDTNLYANNVMLTGRMILAIAAARRGILRADPSAKILTPDPCNMSPTDGIRFIGRFLAAGGDKLCDVIAIHPYRERPESPDLDADTAEMIRTADAHGFKGDLWFTEGIYHQNYVIPAYGLDPHKGCSSDHNWTSAFSSYDLGWGEREAAAYSMRSWLVGLKYSSRVKVYVNWNFQKQVSTGVDLVPTASAFAVNTLGSLLGNATYKQDVTLGQNLRCFVFEDERKRPVAALWDCEKEVDTGYRPMPTVDFTNLPRTLEVFDFAGERRLVGDRSDWRVPTCPMFLRGAPGSLKSFIAQLARVKIDEGDTNPLAAYAKMSSSTQAEIGVRNVLSQPVQGQVRATLNGKDLLAPKTITLKPRESWHTTATLLQSKDTLRDNPVTVSFTTSKNKKYSLPMTMPLIPCHHVSQPLTIDGDLSDWPAGTALPLPNRFMDFDPPAGSKSVPWQGASDLSATLSTAWDDQYFYIGMQVNDDVPHPAPTLASAWQGDGLQIYFDSWGDAREHLATGFGSDDQSYFVWPGGRPGEQIFRDVAPDQQLAFLKVGPVPEIKSAITRTKVGWTYEIAFPIRQIAPITLKEGSTFGFAVIANDADGDYRKRCLTMTPPNTQPFMHPELYPIVVLVQ